MFFINHIPKCSVPAPPILFDQSLSRYFFMTGVFNEKKQTQLLAVITSKHQW